MVLSSTVAALLGCSASPPPAPKVAAPAPADSPAPTPAPPSKEPVETGSACATAEAQCGGGVCVLAIKNDCEQAVSCDTTMVTTCRAGSDMVEAARRKRETFAAKTGGDVSLQGNCPSGEILHTAVRSMACK